MITACLACRAGEHAACTAWDEAADDCCCRGEYDIRAHLLQIRKDEIQMLNADSKKAKGALEPNLDAENVPAGLVANTPQRGDSGYIHPDAWPSTRDIGTLKNAMSVGRKRAAKMYPINVGDICDWAWLAAAGGGVHPIVGCPGNQATDLHHGLDKNTLNNERGMDGVGVNTNVWKLCSFCVSARTRLLTEDLRWVRADEVRPGDRLLGFSEELAQTVTRYEPAIVESVAVVVKHGYRLHMRNGDVLECSDDHQWVASRPSDLHVRWVTTEGMAHRRKSSKHFKLRKVVTPWAAPSTYKDGWLAGLLDGEGSLTGTHLTVCQTIEGHNLVVAEEMRRQLEGRVWGHINWQIHDSTERTKASVVMRVINIPDIMRLLGQTRPLRMLAKWPEFIYGRSPLMVKDSAQEIDHIEDIGDQEFYSIQTSSGTYIAEGYLSHNCHNTWHGANNDTYPDDYDRDDHQDRPWLPIGEIKPHDPVTLADRDEVYRIDKERKADGRKGRSARHPDAGDRSVDDEFDDIVDGLDAGE